MNRNNIFNFVKYAIFAGILYFIMKKIPSINIREYEILMLVVIIGAGLYSYECLLEGYYQSSKLNNDSSKLERFSSDSKNTLDNTLELDVDINDKYQKLDKPYSISNEIIQKARDAANKKRKEEENLLITIETIKKAKKEKEDAKKLKEKLSKNINNLSDIKSKLNNKIDKQNMIIDTKKDASSAKLKKSKYKNKLKSVITDIKDKKNKFNESINEINETNKIIDLAKEKINKSKEIIKSESNNINKLKLKMSKSNNIPNFKINKNNIQHDENVVPLSEDSNFYGINDILDSTPLGKLSNKLISTKKSLDNIKKGVLTGDIPNYDLIDEEIDGINDDFINNDLAKKNIIKVNNKIDRNPDFLQNDLSENTNKKIIYVDDENISEDSIFINPNDEVSDLNLSKNFSSRNKLMKERSEINSKSNNKNINRINFVDSKQFKKLKNKVNYKINEESEESEESDESEESNKNMPLVQDSVNLPVAVDIKDRNKYSGVKSSSSIKSKKQNQLKDMEKNKRQINNMVYRDKNVGVFSEEIEKNVDSDIKKLHNELINPNTLNPEDLSKYGLNKFDIQDEIAGNSGIKDYDDVFQESNFKLINDLDNKGIVRNKYKSTEPKVLRIENAFIKGTNDSQKILVDPSTGMEIKINNLEDDYVKIDKKTGKKYVIVENDEEPGSVKKIFIDNNSNTTEIVVDPRRVKLNKYKSKQVTTKPNLLSMGDTLGLDMSDTLGLDMGDTLGLDLDIDDIAYINPTKSNIKRKSVDNKSIYKKKSSSVDSVLDESKFNVPNNYEMKYNNKLKKRDIISEKKGVISNLIKNARMKSEKVINEKKLNKNMKVVKKVIKDIDDIMIQQDESEESKESEESEESKESNRKSNSSLEISFKIKNVDYYKIPKSKKLSIIQDVKARYAVNLGISRNLIEVELLPGSLVINVRINFSKANLNRNVIAKKMIEYNKSVKEEVINTVSNVLNIKSVKIDNTHPDMVIKEIELKPKLNMISDQKPRSKIITNTKRINNTIKEESEDVIDEDSEDSEDSEYSEDSEDSEDTDDVIPIIPDQPVANTLDGISPQNELRQLQKSRGPRPVPNLPKIQATVKAKSNKELINEIEKEMEEEPTELAGGLRLRSKTEIKEIQKEVRKAETKNAIKKLKDNIEGKPVFRTKEEKVKYHRHDVVHDEISTVKRNLLDKIDDLKDNIKSNNKTETVTEIEKRNVKILLKELLSHKILNLEEVDEIYSSAKKGDVNLENLIKVLEKLRDSTTKKFKDSGSVSGSVTGSVTGKKSSYGDMKYDELPIEKRTPLGDQLPPDDWDNQYTLLNTDKWSVPQRKPPLCIASNNMDPLPSNESGYPMLLKEWDNSRVISNTYINKKWANDQIDTSDN